MWVQYFFKIPEQYSVLPTLVTLFAVTHVLRLVQLNYTMLQDRNYAKHHNTSRCIPSVTIHYVLASVVVLWVFDYTHLAVALLSSFTITHMLYKHCEVALCLNQRRNIE